MGGEFFIPGRHPAELLEPIEEALHQIARLIAMPIVVPKRLAIGPWRNDHFGLLRFDVLDQGIGVITLVRDHRLRARGLLEQGERLGDVGLLGAGERKAKGVAERIDDAVQLGGESAARAAQSLRAVFFWAPAACWWARTAVLSSITSSRSRSPLRASKMRSQTPSLAQRAKRTYVVCQLPNSAGRSRQGAPVRAIHNTASKNKRLSLAVAPRSEALPGKRSLIRSHWSSRSTRRSIAPIPSRSWNGSLNGIVNRT